MDTQGKINADPGDPDPQPWTEVYILHFTPLPWGGGGSDYVPVEDKRGIKKIKMKRQIDRRKKKKKYKKNFSCTVYFMTYTGSIDD